MSATTGRPEQYKPRQDHPARDGLETPEELDKLHRRPAEPPDFRIADGLLDW